MIGNKLKKKIIKVEKVGSRLMMIRLKGLKKYLVLFQRALVSKYTHAIVQEYY